MMIGPQLMKLRKLRNRIRVYTYDDDDDVIIISNEFFSKLVSFVETMSKTILLSISRSTFYSYQISKCATFSPVY